MAPMKRRLAIVFALTLWLLAPVARGQNPDARSHWVTTWATAPIGRPPLAPAAAPGGGRGNAPTPAPAPTNQTLRQFVLTSIGGDALRVVVANTFGTGPLSIGAASVALRETGRAIAMASARPLTFGGRASATIPSGAVLVSDPVSLAVPAFSDLAIDLYLPDDLSTAPVTMHAAAYKTNGVVAGNHAGEHEFTSPATMTSWFYLARVEVRTAERTAAVVTLGDSITDGTGSTVDGNARWTDQLAQRLAAQRGGVKTAVLNVGIGGNRLLSEGGATQGANSLARFDRDVAALTNATHLILLEGINDIGAARENAAPSAADLIAAQQQIIERAHARGLKVIGATLTPFEGAGYFTAAGEAKRQAVNAWIRTGKAYDGVIDFDAAVRDPQQPSKFRPECDRGDHLHPNDTGYQAMGRAIDLALFK